MKNDFYRGKRVLILGASGGLGSALARQLAGAGAARLYLSGRKEARLRQLAEALRARGMEADVLACDAADRAALRACLARCLADGLDGAFLALGAAPSKSGDGYEEPEEIARCLRTNVLAPMAAATILARGWEAEGGRHFLGAVSSQAGLLPLPFAPAYGASKAGLHSWCDAVRPRMAASGAALTEIMPGFFESPMGRRFAGRKWFVLTAEEAAARTLRAVAEGERTAIFPWPLRWGIGLARALPSAVSRPLMAFFAFDTLPDGESFARGRDAEKKQK